MGNSSHKPFPHGRTRENEVVQRSPHTYSSQFSLSSFLPNISGRSFASGVTQQSAYSVSRPWSRVSRRRWQARTLNDPLVASKTAWPVPYIEAVFLPEFKIKGDVTEKDFKFINHISKGAFGTVYRVEKVDTGDEYALKVLSKSKLISQNAVEQVKDEVRIQTMCGHHPFIVNSPFFWQNRKQVFIVSEYVSGGELLQLCQEYGTLPEDLVQVYVAEIALALDFLHNAGVVYRDLKLENLLLDHEGHLQLIDFGLAKWLKYGQRTSTICGTLQYMAPEVMSMEPYGHSVDWWSLGVVMCCMLSGEFPTPVPPVSKLATDDDDDDDDDRRASPRRQAGLLIPSQSFSPAARTLVQRLLEVNPSSRLRSMIALQSTAFYHGFNMGDARARKFQPKEILEKHYPEGPPPRELEEEKEEDSAIAQFSNF